MIMHYIYIIHVEIYMEYNSETVSFLDFNLVEIQLCVYHFIIASSLFDDDALP